MIGLQPVHDSPFDLAVRRLVDRLAPPAAQDTPRGLPAIRTDEDLKVFVRDAFGVVVPDTQVCPHHTTPFRAFADAYFARRSMAVWKGSRGFAGKSFLFGLLGVTEALTLHADVKILGGSGQQSQRVLEAMSRFWNAPCAPREYLASEPALKLTRFQWGNTVEALMASQTSVRGPHPQRLRLDEVDAMRQPIFDAAQGQTMGAPGIPAQTVAGSTHQNVDGTMTAVLKLAVERGWPIYTWCYRETLQPHGWLDPAEVERKRNEVTAAMWETEYELQEPSPEGRAINTEAVERMFDAELGEYDGRDGECIECESPVASATYATGADWARKVDFTVIWTWRTDVRPIRLVAFERVQRRPWPQMVARFNDRLTRFAGAAAHDGTGIGDVVAGYLTHNVEAVMMVGRDRADLLSEYVNAVEHGDVQAPRIAFAYGEHKYAKVDDLYGAGHLPDSIAAAALAYRAARLARDASALLASAPISAQSGVF